MLSLIMRLPEMDGAMALGLWLMFRSLQSLPLVHSPSLLSSLAHGCALFARIGSYGQTAGSQHRCLHSSIDFQFNFHHPSLETNR